jgi:hypothetical protein
MSHREDIEKQVDERIKELCHHMYTYLDFYEKANPFNKPEQLEFHIQTIDLRHKLGISAALQDNTFIKSLWNTLDAWDLNIRGTKLVPLKKFKEELLNHEKQIVELDGARINDPDLPLERTAGRLWNLIKTMKLSISTRSGERVKNPVVVGTKTLHHLLPDLIPPVDREYTRPFFMFWMQYFQNYPHRVFPYIWKKFVFIAHETNPVQYVNKTKWSTSITKILDNAVVGYCKYHNVPKLR